MSAEEKQRPTEKLCSACNTTKPLEGGFYRAGASWQKLCKPCHNERRKNYPFKQSYIKKPNGFARLPEEVKENIIAGLRVNSVRGVALSNGIKYQTLINWNKRGWIPTREETQRESPSEETPAP